MILGLIILFFILNNLGLSVYNPMMRDHLTKFIYFGNKKLTYYILSFFPLLLVFIIAISYPDIVGMFWIFGLIISNFNGCIIPCWMKLRVLKEQNSSLWKRLLISFLLCFYVICALVGIYFKLVLEKKK